MKYFILFALINIVINTVTNHAFLTRIKSIRYCIGLFTLNTFFAVGAGCIAQTYIPDPTILKYVAYSCALSFIVYIHLVFAESIAKKIFVMISTWLFATVALFIATPIAQSYSGIIEENKLQSLTYGIRTGIQLLYLGVIYVWVGRPFKAVLNAVSDRTIHIMLLYPILGFLLLINNYTVSLEHFGPFDSVYDALLLMVFIILGFVLVFAGISSASQVISLQYNLQMQARDNAERLRLKEEKAEFEAQSRQLQKTESLGRMAGAVAHHFNNQLGVVIGNLELAIREVPLGTESAKWLATAMKSSKNAAEMSGLMLTYLGQSFEERETVDLAWICRRNLAMLQTMLPANAALETDIPAPGPIVFANADQIQRVLTSLVANAFEALGGKPGVMGLNVKTVLPAAIPAQRRFPIDWQPQSSAYACLEVTDPGCGIEAKDMENLFDPFFSSKSTGRGMGLAVVLGILRAHDGAVAVESTPGGGSMFRVYFPVCGDAGPTVAETA